MLPGPARAVAAVAVALAFTLGAFLLPATADHAQETPAGTVTFDHRGGNEWWVEAVVTHDGVRPDAVDARDEGDTSWHALEFKDWGEWGGSFHVEPGNRVMFRSTTDAGTAESCWFTHPAGAEECDATPPPPPPPGDFDATFDTPGGNAWWVEVYVDGNEPIAAVEARANEGPWHELTKRSWGAWARSFHVPDGSIVEFRAESTGGDTDMSGQYRWPSGEQVGSDPDPEPEPPGALDAAFAPKASNEWWVETFVVANSSISSVEARADSGPWHALTLRSWGAWATSFHAPSGSAVTFRATNETGATGESVAFAWPDAVPVDEQGEPWPHEGSYVRYDEWYDPPGSFSSGGDATFVYHRDAWRVWCIGEEGIEGDIRPYSHYAEVPPPMNPTVVVPGMTVDAEAYTCGESSFEVVVRHTESEGIHHEGDAATVSTWYADRIAECNCIHYEAEWERELGIVVDWNRAGREAIGADLEDTDAPIVG